MKLVSKAPTTSDISKNGGFSPLEWFPFEAHVTSPEKYQAITFLEPLRNYSFEELRLADYAGGMMWKTGACLNQS